MVTKFACVNTADWYVQGLGDTVEAAYQYATSDMDIGDIQALNSDLLTFSITDEAFEHVQMHGGIMGINKMLGYALIINSNNVVQVVTTRGYH